MTSLKVVFAGTPAFALPILTAIHASKHKIVALYTQPDRQSGRGRKMQASPVKIWGLENAYPILQPLNFKDPLTVKVLQDLQPDVMIVIAYGLILPTSVLNIPRFGCINVHASLLPELRGAAPIQYALLQGYKQTGVTLMQMDAGMDTGPVFASYPCPIAPTDTAASLHDKLAPIAATPLIQLLDNLAADKSIELSPQDSQRATYAPKINKTDASINWRQSARSIEQSIRAFNPWPIAYTHIKDIVLRIHSATFKQQVPGILDGTSIQNIPGTITAIDTSGLWVATGEGLLGIQSLQLPSSNIITIQDWINSQRTLLAVGNVLL